MPLTTRSARILAACNYLVVMLKNAFKPCIPTKAAKALDRPEWIREIKHDGYRLIVQRDGKRARLFSRNGYDSRIAPALLCSMVKRCRLASMVDPTSTT